MKTWWQKLKPRYRIKKQQGLISIPLILGLFLIIIAIPITTKLSQQSQDVRNRAAVHMCDAGQRACCNSTQYQVCSADGMNWGPCISCGTGNICTGSGNCGPRPTSVPSCTGTYGCIDPSQCQTTTSGSCDAGLVCCSEREPYPTHFPSNTPVPVATNTPRPTATNTPRPTATNTPRPRYRCNSANGICLQDPNGDYLNLGQCIDDCIATSPRPTATNTPRPTSVPSCTGTYGCIDPSQCQTTTSGSCDVGLVCCSEREPYPTHFPSPTNTPRPTATNTSLPTPTTGPTSITKCPPDQTECLSENRYKRCEYDQEWGWQWNSYSCKEGYICQGNSCVWQNQNVTPTPECTGYEKICTSDTSRRFCSVGKWQTESCPYGCQNGNCLARANCDGFPPGYSRCSGNNVETCTTYGAWHETECYGCESARCKPVPSPTGTPPPTLTTCYYKGCIGTNCLRKSRQIASGTCGEIVKDECSSNLNCGMITPTPTPLFLSECSPGQERCSGYSLQKCADEGYTDEYSYWQSIHVWKEIEFCWNGCNNDTLSCKKLCQPGQAVCEGNYKLTCSTDGKKTDRQYCLNCTKNEQGDIKCKDESAGGYFGLQDNFFTTDKKECAPGLKKRCQQHICTCVEEDDVSLGEKIVDTLANMPLIGPERIAESWQIANANLSDLSAGQSSLGEELSHRLTAGAHLMGFDDLIDTSNRLFYQPGMDDPQREYYRTHPSARIGDAFVVGMATMSVADPIASGWVAAGGFGGLGAIRSASEMSAFMKQGAVSVLTQGTIGSQAGQAATQWALNQTKSAIGAIDDISRMSSSTAYSPFGVDYTPGYTASALIPGDIQLSDYSGTKLLPGENYFMGGQQWEAVDGFIPAPNRTMMWKIKPVEQVEYGQKLNSPVLADVASYESVTRQYVNNLADEIRRRRGGTSYSRPYAVSEAVELTLPYDYTSIPVAGMIPADGYENVTAMIRAVDCHGGVCRHQAPILTQGLRDAGFESTVQVWHEWADESGEIVSAHTLSYIPERNIFVNPGLPNNPKQAKHMVIPFESYFQGKYKPVNWTYLDPKTNKWVDLDW